MGRVRTFLKPKLREGRIVKHRINHAVPCLHCERVGNIDRRGLCRPCYSRPEIRSGYPPAVRSYGHRGHGITPTASAEFVPTHAIPGTLEKVEVFERRAAAKLPLFHPRDARHKTGIPEIDMREDVA